MCVRARVAHRRRSSLGSAETDRRRTRLDAPCPGAPLYYTHIYRERRYIGRWPPLSLVHTCGPPRDVDARRARRASPLRRGGAEVGARGPPLTPLLPFRLLTHLERKHPGRSNFPLLLSLSLSLTFPSWWGIISNGTSISRKGCMRGLWAWPWLWERFRRFLLTGVRWCSVIRFMRGTWARF